MNYILNYSEQKYIEEYFEYVFQFEKLVQGKSGTVAIIDIPITLISEIFFKIIPIAYKKKNASILRKLLVHSISNRYGYSAPIIYDARIWGPEIFKSDVDSYIRYLFPEDTKKGLTSISYINNLNEITFLLDCYAVSGEYYVSHPTYLTFNDIDTPRRIILKLSDQKFVSFIEEMFEIKLKNFLDLIIKRQKMILGWHGRNFEIKASISKTLTKFEEIASKIP